MTSELDSQCTISGKYIVVEIKSIRKYLSYLTFSPFTVILFNGVIEKGSCSPQIFGSNKENCIMGDTILMYHQMNQALYYNQRLDPVAPLKKISLEVLALLLPCQVRSWRISRLSFSRMLNSNHYKPGWWQYLIDRRLWFGRDNWYALLCNKTVIWFIWVCSCLCGQPPVV